MPCIWVMWSIGQLFNHFNYPFFFIAKNIHSFKFKIYFYVLQNTIKNPSLENVRKGGNRLSSSTKSLTPQPRGLALPAINTINLFWGPPRTDMADHCAIHTRDNLLSFNTQTLCAFVMMVIFLFQCMNNL